MKFSLLVLTILLLGFFSFSLTWLIIRVAARRNIMSVPNIRSLHDKPTPTGGGLAIIMSWYTGITVLFLCGIMEKSLYLVLLCGVILGVVSIVDDFIGLKPVIRLVFQFLTATAAFYLLGGLRPLVMPQIHFDYNFIVYPLAIIGMVWFINLFNFMDGVDGFASLQAIIICAVLFVFTWDISVMILIICVTGFIYWNWPKAKVFMGDVGSTQLGFILVVFGIHFHNIYEFSIMNWIMLASPFWFDATLTLFRRWRNGENISEAHRKHAYQRIVLAGFSHEKVNLFLVLINLINILFISLYRAVKVMQIPIVIITLLFYYLITLYVDRKVPFKKGDL